MKNDNVIVIGPSQPNIGYIARTNTAGKEFEMVTQYIDHLIKKYSKLKKKKAVIFIEPQIDTGYPDIVVMEYFSKPSLPWKSVRSSLSSTDYKILFYIQSERYLSVEKISEILGYPVDVVGKSMSRLESCGLIHISKSKKYVRNIPLNMYYRIHKIIAIEAKIDKWQAAIRQANNNIWFSTESYILMNRETYSSAVSSMCESMGLGIIVANGEIKTLLPSQKRKGPISYASLQFNEWFLRYIYRENVEEKNGASSVVI